MGVAFALIAFLLLEMLAEAAGLVGAWLAVIIVPAYFRYLLYLLEARANGRTAPSPGIELFNWIENYWSLFPLVLVCCVIWGEYFLLGRLPFIAALLPGLFLAFVLPASLAVLAVTRSPVESLNPAAIYRVVRACGGDYLLAPLMVMAAALLLAYLLRIGTPFILIRAAALYASFLMFTLTGQLLYLHGATIQVDIAEPVEPDEQWLDDALTRERTKVLNHAYGFISRDNRQGGLQHIYRRIEGEADPDGAWRWFFEQMLNWESKEPALYYAHAYLGRLLAQRRDVEALKVIRRCLLEDPAFKPLRENRDAALEVAVRLRDADLVAHLRSR
jgi:hypothetical protein